jgi:hypothetical protein
MPKKQFLGVPYGLFIFHYLYKLQKIFTRIIHMNHSEQTC